MSQIKKVAVVTGSNKGIGLAIVRGLCKVFDGDVFLTARNEERGKNAVSLLEKEGLKPKFHILDINNHESIVTFKEYLEIRYKGLDILVNNAAILYPDDSKELLSVMARETIKVNYLSNLDVCEVLFPLLRPHARVCNMSSLGCQFAYKALSPEIKKRIRNPSITLPEVTDLMNKFVENVENGSYIKEGYTLSHDNGMGVYCFSKIGVTLMSAIQQKQLDASGKEDVIINSVSPGYVNTDMTQGKGHLTPDEGAVTPLYSCLLSENMKSPKGEFIRDSEIFDWMVDELPVTTPNLAKTT